jgi:hypothetical protein
MESAAKYIYLPDGSYVPVYSTFDVRVGEVVIGKKQNVSLYSVKTGDKFRYEIMFDSSKKPKNPGEKTIIAALELMSKKIKDVFKGNQKVNEEKERENALSLSFLTGGVISGLVKEYQEEDPEIRKKIALLLNPQDFLKLRSQG